MELDGRSRLGEGLFAGVALSHDDAPEPYRVRDVTVRMLFDDDLDVLEHGVSLYPTVRGSIQQSRGHVLNRTPESRGRP